MLHPSQQGRQAAQDIKDEVICSATTGRTWGPLPPHIQPELNCPTTTCLLVRKATLTLISQKNIYTRTGVSSSNQATVCDAEQHRVVCGRAKEVTWAAVTEAARQRQPVMPRVCSMDARMKTLQLRYYMGEDYLKEDRGNMPMPWDDHTCNQLSYSEIFH